MAEAVADNKATEERAFRALIFQILNKFLTDANINDQTHERVMSQLRSAYNFAQGGEFRNFDLTIFENECAYFHRFGSLSASLVRCRILEAVNGCGELRTRIQRHELEILNLASGAGTDAVGFCSAFYQLGVEQCHRLKIALIDIVDGWKTFFDSLKDHLENGDYGNASKLFKSVEIAANFMRVDLDSCTYPREFEQKLKTADIVIISRLLAHLKDTTPFLERIYSNIKQDALVIIIDCPIYVDNPLQKTDFETIYTSSGGETEYFSLEFPSDSEEMGYSMNPNIPSNYIKSMCWNSKCNVYVLKKNEVLCENAEEEKAVEETTKIRLMECDTD